MANRVMHNNHKWGDCDECANIRTPGIEPFYFFEKKGEMLTLVDLSIRALESLVNTSEARYAAIMSKLDYLERDIAALKKERSEPAALPGNMDRIERDRREPPERRIQCRNCKVSTPRERVRMLDKFGLKNGVVVGTVFICDRCDPDRTVFDYFDVGQ